MEQPWPKISIITPSYNQGQFLEQTIRSVLDQNYPNLEYIVIDGGSSDQSVEIIKKYASSIHYWVSEPDKGQADAINKGFARASGDILAWINSDDYYRPGAFSEIASRYQKGPHWWVGMAREYIQDPGYEGKLYIPPKVNLRRLFYERQIIPQVSVFWTRELWTAAGSRIADLHYAMDYELWLRFGAITPPELVPAELALLRIHRDTKTSGEGNGMARYFEECDRVRREWFHRKKRSPASLAMANLYISFMTRFRLFSKDYNLRHFAGRRQIPRL